MDISGLESRLLNAGFSSAYAAKVVKFLADCRKLMQDEANALFDEYAGKCVALDREPQEFWQELLDQQVGRALFAIGKPLTSSHGENGWGLAESRFEEAKSILQSCEISEDSKQDVLTGNFYEVVKIEGTSMKALWEQK